MTGLAKYRFRGPPKLRTSLKSDQSGKAYDVSKKILSSKNVSKTVWDIINNKTQISKQIKLKVGDSLVQDGAEGPFPYDPTVVPRKDRVQQHLWCWLLSLRKSSTELLSSSQPKNHMI
ncbi:hypothetical protein J6590_021632 [Homalodisca vitripennis]|nr:hypothetical protein J6590_021632 [Homalodisca vitripennis]